MSSLLHRLMANIALQILSLVILMGLISVAYAAYTTITPASIATGQPVSQTLMQQIKSNLDDLNTRVTALEANAPVTVPVGGGKVGGQIWSERIDTGMASASIWNSQYRYSQNVGGHTLASATTACAARSPQGKWRVPTQAEFSIGRTDTSLFNYDSAWRIQEGGAYVTGNVFYQTTNTVYGGTSIIADSVVMNIAQNSTTWVAIGLRCIAI